LPAETSLVSLGPVHHAFAFFYHRPIPIVDVPLTKESPGFDYFCLHTYDCDPPELPFPWTQVAVVSCDRLKGRPIPKDRVFIGRRLSVDRIGLNGASPTVE
jgi:hypothetical protein